MSERLPPWVIRNDQGLYCSMVGWTRHRYQALSFDDAVSARDWIAATPAIKGSVTNEPFDATAEALSRAGAGLEPVVPLTSMARHDYEPVR
jgi:hypothetical protein